jgi:molybdopterin-guanine dinucleotide biosynthesis protein A
LSDEHPRADITLAVLAGGEGRRMGRPKAELRIGGRPILEYLLDRWRWDGPTMLVTAPGRERSAGSERFMREVSDRVAGAGPLRGVLTALEAATTPLVIVTTCDMPGMGIEQFQWLMDRLRARDDLLGVMCRRGKTIEPFPLALRASARDEIRQRYVAGLRSTFRLTEDPRFIALPAPAEWPKACWTNLNTPADLAAFDAGSAGIS